MKNKSQIGIFLAARSGSKRLLNKHFLRVNSNLNVIDLCILRLKKTKLVKKIFLCTTKKKEDDKFKKVCKIHKINLCRGSNNNVAKRIIDCAKKNSVKIIVRITADCPIIDAKIVDKLHQNGLKILPKFLKRILSVVVLFLNTAIQIQKWILIDCMIY